MARKIFIAVAATLVGMSLATATVSADGLLGGGGDLLGGGDGGLLGGGGGGGLLDGGGGGVQLPGGGGGLPGSDILPPPPGGTEPAPTPPPTTTPPPDDGGGGGTAGPGGHGGRGGGSNQNGAGHGASSESGSGERRSRWAPPPAPQRRPNGVPTAANPTLTNATLGAAPIGVPNFVIDQFEIPPFLLPIYQACGTQYDIPWQVLASINKIETGFGTNLNVSSAGALGWMQFIPSTWQMYGVDASGDGRKDPYNPVDAICAAARYLKAAGGDQNLREGIFAYNHADWYVDEVLLYAKQYGNLPTDLVDSLTGLTAGDRFPVAADSRYADDLTEKEAARSAAGDGGAGASATQVVTDSPAGRAVNIYSRAGAPVIAVNDGTIKRIGQDRERGNFVVLQDTYGNRFTYADLGAISRVYPASHHRKLSHSDFELVNPGHDSPPEAPATRGASRREHNGNSPDVAQGATPQLRNTEGSSRRLYALPDRPHNARRADIMGQVDPASGLAGFSTFNPLVGEVKRLHRQSLSARPLREGSQVNAGTILGRLGQGGALAPHLNFSIRPVGRGAPRIDPKPILDGWKLLEATAIYRAQNKNPFAQQSSSNVTQDLLLSKTQLEHRVLDDPRLSIYECGRQDIQTGQIDQRILAAMEYLADNGFRLTITSLKCGHGLMTASGYVSEHSTGDAMDIAMVNGIPIAGHQGPGSLTESVIRTLLRLQGPMVPHQVISLMSLGGPSFSLPDHWDHIHVGYMPDASATPAGKSEQASSLLKPGQWKELVGRISEIDNPHVRTSASRFALPAHQPRNGRRASHAHAGD